MKIVLVGLKLSIGNQLMMGTLAEALKRQGHQVVGVGDKAYPYPGTFPFHAVADSRSYGRMMLQTLNIPLWFTISKRIKHESPDVCYFISSHSLNAPILALLRQGTGRPLLVSHIHDPVPHGGSPVALWVSLSQWLQLRFSDRAVVYGDRLKVLCAAHDHYPPARVVVVPHGAYRHARAVEPEPVPCRWFSLLGRIESYKGIEVFLEAARVVLQSRPDVRFLIGGNGDLAPYEANIQRLGSSIEIRNETLSNEEMDRIMRHSWAVVLPYRDGTQSGVIPVAYYNACPVIVSDVGSLPELVTPDTGAVVPPNDADGLANAMLDWADTGRRHKAAHAAFHYYRENLIWDDITAAFLQQLFVSPGS